MIWGGLTTDETSYIPHNDAKGAEKARDGAGGGLKIQFSFLPNLRPEGSAYRLRGFAALESAGGALVGIVIPGKNTGDRENGKRENKVVGRSGEHVLFDC